MNDLELFDHSVWYMIPNPIVHCRSCGARIIEDTDYHIGNDFICEECFDSYANSEAILNAYIWLFLRMEQAAADGEAADNNMAELMCGDIQVLEAYRDAHAYEWRCFLAEQ